MMDPVRSRSQFAGQALGMQPHLLLSGAFYIVGWLLFFIFLFKI